MASARRPVFGMALLIRGPIPLQRIRDVEALSYAPYDFHGFG